MPSPEHERVTCPNCDKRYRWQASLVGQRVPCKHCDQPFLVPDAPGTGLPIEPEPHNDDGTYDLDYDPAVQTPAAPINHAKPAHSGKCPTCNSPVRDGAVICMNCGFNMMEGKKIAAPTVEALPEAEKKAMRRELSGMKWVRVGLWLNLASILIMFGIVPGTFVAAFYDSGLLYTILGLSTFAFLGLGTLGSLLCLTAPKESGARPILIVSMALSIGSTIWVLLIDFGPMSEDGYWIVDLIGNVATALFLYFFVKLAQYLAFDQITERAEKVLGLYIAIALGAYALVIPLLGCVVLIFVLAAAVYTLFLYIGLLIDLNNALTYHIREQSV
ncbi:MAG: hypothetical protein ACPGYV_06040 [Phycisphaeraceae bacterium]